MTDPDRRRRPSAGGDSLRSGSPNPAPILQIDPANLADMIVTKVTEMRIAIIDIVIPGKAQGDCRV